MGAAEKISYEERIDKPSLRQVNSFKNKENDFKTISGINNIKNEIQKELMNSAGILPAHKREELFEELKKVGDTDLASLEKLKNQVKMEVMSGREELKQRQNNEKNYLDLFNKHAEDFSPKSRKEYMKEFKDLPIKKQLEWISSFEKTEVPVRAKLREKFRAYSLAEQAKYPDFFNKSRSQKEKIIKEMVKEEQSAQKKVIKAYENAFNSPEAKYTCKETLNLCWKWFIDNKRTLEDRKSALHYFKIGLQTEAENCRKYEALPKNQKKWLKNNFKTVFEKIKPQANAKAGVTIQHDSSPKSFYDLNKDERDVLFQHLKDNEKNIKADILREESLESDYDKVLQKAKTDHVISEQTLKSYRKWFKSEVKKDPKNAEKIKEDFWKDPENIKRKRLLDNFEKLMNEMDGKKEISQALNKKQRGEFYKGSHSERLTIFMKLVEKHESIQQNPEKVESKETMLPEEREALEKKITNLKSTAKLFESTEKWEKATEIYETILDLDPENLDALKQIEALKKQMNNQEEDLSDPENLENQKNMIQKAIKKAKSSETVQKDLKYATMAKMLAKMKKHSDRKHGGISKSEDKIKDLQNNEQRNMQQALSEDTNNQMVVENKNGQIQTKQTVNIDLEKLGQNPEDYLKLKEQYADVQFDSKEQEKDHKEIGFVKKDRQLTGDEAEFEASKMEDNARMLILGLVVSDLTLQNQKALSPELMKLMMAQVANEDLSIDLKKAA